MSAKEADTTDIREFVARVESALAPGFAEVLSEETRKTQRALLVLSFLLLLVAIGAIEFSGQVEFLGLKFAGALAKTTAIVLLLVICAFLETLVGARCYSEWYLWRMRNRVGEVEAQSISEGLESLRSAIQNDMTRVVESTNSESAVLFGEGSLPGIRVKIPVELARHLPLRQRLVALLFGRRLYRASGTVLVSQEASESLAQLKRFGPHYLAFYADLNAYEKSRKLRLLVEVLFPLFFGAAGIAIAAAKLTGAA